MENSTGYECPWDYQKNRSCHFICDAGCYSLLSDFVTDVDLRQAVLEQLRPGIRLASASLWGCSLVTRSFPFPDDLASAGLLPPDF